MPNQHTSPSSPVSRPSFPVILGVVAAFVVAVWHISNYWFLTDDAFIAFRYARNLSHGAGLVFNPGHEAVEGYTSLLWVLILAALDRVGIRPEHSANVLGALAAIALWLGVVWFVSRWTLRSRAPWMVLFPAWGLAVNRSFAVWATGGLETRWFEALAVLGALRLSMEQQQEDSNLVVRRLAPWFFALVCLTRPEGILVTGMCAAAVMLWRTKHHRLVLVQLLREWLPCLVAISVQLLFRRLYYGEWLPNTWHAKVGGEFLFATGLNYVAAFVLEYMAWAWIPLLVMAYVHRARSGETFLILTVGLVMMPLTVYIVAIGGDHFEYRPLGLHVVFAFLLMSLGALQMMNSARSKLWMVPYAFALVGGSMVIPWESRAQFPQAYQTGFPGAQLPSVQAAAFLDPQRHPVTRLPGIRTLATSHRTLTQELTARLIAVRQEEHHLFFLSVLPAGMELGELVVRGVLPPDAYVAIDCVGAIPYYSGLRTLDRLGLTDARVSHSKRTGTNMAHWKFATLDYARERGVDLWAEDRVHLICGLDSRPMRRAILGQASADAYVADLGGSRFILCELPLGPESAKSRMPKLHFQPLTDTAFLSTYLPRLAQAWSDSLAKNPMDDDRSSELAQLYLSMGDPRRAIPLLQGLVARGRGSARVLETLAYAQAESGLQDEARETLRKALAEAARTGDTDLLNRWKQAFNRKEETR